jgi:predicted aldo/keto reductase-like oxidoreductase
MKPSTSRRDFLQAGLALPVVGLAARTSAGKAIVAAPPAAASPSLDSSPQLSYRILGKTGLKVTSVGFGCMITSDASVIERGADIGITYFDTARSYQHGNNERMVGAAIGKKRNGLVLSSKSDGLDKNSLLSDLDTSLRELGTDYLDIWYLHGRDKATGVSDEMFEAQQVAKQQGKIRFTGVSTHQPKGMIPLLVKQNAVDVVLITYNFTMDKGVGEAIEQAANAGMGVVAMKVMAGGYRAGNPRRSFYPQLAKQGALLAALKWVLKNPKVNTTIPSMTDMDQLQENLKAMAGPFGELEEKLLAQQLQHIAPIYCRMCGECDGACSQGLPVADLLRYLTYAEGYGQFSLGREHFLALPKAIAAVRCRDCANCTVNCPHGVKVASRVAHAQELFG